VNPDVFITLALPLLTLVIPSGLLLLVPALLGSTVMALPFDRLSKLSVSRLVIVSGALFVGSGIAMILLYGQSLFLPALVSNFGASLAAFLLALRWDHERDRERLRQESAEEYEHLEIEAQRRLGPIKQELEVDHQSVLELATKLEGVAARDGALHPLLLDGAWAANAPRLSEILTDHSLVGSLASAYGRIEELRWRVRARTEMMSGLGVNGRALAKPIIALASQLDDDLGQLIPQVDHAQQHPPVRGAARVSQIAVEVLVAAPQQTVPEPGNS